jgi:hypothetical protein
VPSQRQQHGVSVDDPPSRRDKQGTVGIPVERHTQLCALRFDTLLQPLNVQRPAPGIDISPIWIHSNRLHVRLQRPE